jgi:hypothetical protein
MQMKMLLKLVPISVETQIAKGFDSIPESRKYIISNDATLTFFTYTLILRLKMAVWK